MSPKDFQHEVLTILSQLQEAQNMMELSQIEIESILHDSLDQLGSPRGEQGAKAGDSDDRGSCDLSSLPAKVDSIDGKLGNTLNILRDLQNRPAQAGAPTNNQQAPSQMQKSDPRVDTILSKLGELDRLQKNNFETLQRLVNGLTTSMRNSNAQLESAISSNSGGGGSSWVLIVLVSFACLGVLLLGFMLHKQQQDRYIYSIL